MASAPVRIKARQGLSAGGAGPLTATAHSTSSQVSAKQSRKPVSGVREHGCLVCLAHPSSSRAPDHGHLPRGNRGGVAGPLHVYAPAKEDVSSSSSGSSSASSRQSQIGNNAVPATSLAMEAEGHGISATVTSSEILAPVQADMNQLTVNLKSVVGERSDLLKAAADQIFGGGGKKLRPAIVFMVSRATAQLGGLRCVQTGGCTPEAQYVSKLPLAFLSGCAGNLEQSWDIECLCKSAVLFNALTFALCRDITEKHRRLAEITEMIHTASLMHDDVVDESPVRRGKLTAAVACCAQE
jgi:hypothetical protein